MYIIQTREYDSETHRFSFRKSEVRDHMEKLNCDSYSTKQKNLTKEALAEMVVYMKSVISECRAVLRAATVKFEEQKLNFGRSLTLAQLMEHKISSPKYFDNMVFCCHHFRIHLRER